MYGLKGRGGSASQGHRTPYAHIHLGHPASRFCPLCTPPRSPCPHLAPHAPTWPPGPWAPPAAPTPRPSPPAHDRTQLRAGGASDGVCGLGGAGTEWVTRWMRIKPWPVLPRQRYTVHCCPRLRWWRPRCALTLVEDSLLHPLPCTPCREPCCPVQSAGPMGHQRPVWLIPWRSYRGGRSARGCPQW